MEAPADEQELRRDLGAVLVPALRTREAGGRGRADLPDGSFLQRHPPAGVVVFGRTPGGASRPDLLLEALRRELEERGAPRPFACCDLEEGAGLHFEGEVRLPPAAALAAADEAPAATGLAGRLRCGRRTGWVAAAGLLTARRARARGVELVLAPVCDLDASPPNPVLGARAFAADPERVGACAAEFVAGLHLGGAGACAKHFPGHGAAAEDSHLALARLDPRAGHTRERLESRELAAFAPALRAGADALMLAHLDAPALTEAPGTPLSLAPLAVARHVRGALAFRGAVLSDALDMGAVAALPRRRARALAAGCDGLLCPGDLEEAVEELLAALADGSLTRARLAEAAERMRRLRASALGRAAGDALAAPRALGRLDPEAFGRRAARASLRQVGGPWPWRRGRAFELLAPLPEDLGPEARGLVSGLREEPSGRDDPAGVVLPVVLERAAGRGRYALDAAAEARLEARVLELRRLKWPVAILWLGTRSALPSGWGGGDGAPCPVLVAHAATPCQVEAVRAWLGG